MRPRPSMKTIRCVRPQLIGMLCEWFRLITETHQEGNPRPLSVVPVGIRYQFVLPGTALLMLQIFISNTNWDFVSNRKILNTHRVIVIEYICRPDISFSYLKVDIVTQVSPPSFY